MNISFKFFAENHIFFYKRIGLTFIIYNTIDFGLFQFYYTLNYKNIVNLFLQIWFLGI